jgi:large subunit ribosomal protein L23
MEKIILVRPVISEKAEQNRNNNKYSFIVHKGANKIEIKKAVEKAYNVLVDSVNTTIMPGKSKVRFTKAGVQRGKRSSLKKAVVTLQENESIDFFGEV